jgi:predicted phage terminase large subunit-like protein
MEPEFKIQKIQRTKTPSFNIRRTKDPKLKVIQNLLQNPHLITRELNNRSFYHFVEWAWPEVSNHEFYSNWHIPYICQELELIAYRVGNRIPKEYDLIINIPPGMTKTILCTILFPVWCWTKWFWMRFITGSYSAALALESAEYSRDLMKSDRFRAVYPELDIRDDKDTKSNYKVVKRIKNDLGGNSWDKKGVRILQGGNRYSTAVKGTITGFHADISIWDDPINPNQAVSDKERERANRWVDRTLSTRKTDKKISTTIGIMQRLHQDDPSGHILAKNKKNVKLISLPGEIKNYKEKLHPPELIKFYVNDLLDCRRMDWDVLKDMEADLGQYGYAGQVGQDPTPAGGGMFKTDHIIPIITYPAAVNFLKVIRYWDKAGSDGKGAFTVGVKMALLTNDRYLIMDVKRGQWGTAERERVIRETAIADNMNLAIQGGKGVTIYIEQEPGSGGKESAEATIRNLAGFACYADRPSGDKVYRADPFSVQVNNGNVLMLKAEWNHLYIEELRFFPFSTYKDQTDASSGAFNHLTGKRIAGRVT